MKKTLHTYQINRAQTCAADFWFSMELQRIGLRKNGQSRRLMLAFLLSFLSIFEFGVSAHAIPLARLRRIEPTVMKQKERVTGWTMARERDALAYGDTIRTGTRGKADVLFANGTKIALRGNTSIQILSPSNPNSPLVIRLFGALSEVFVRPKGNTQIRTAAAIAAARGTEYLVRLADENTTEVTVTEGSVDFSNEKGSVLVEANQQSVARLGSAPETPVAVDVSGALRWTADVAGLPLEWETPFRATDARNAAQQLKTAQTTALAAPQNNAAQQRLGEAFYDAFEYSEAATQFEKVAQNDPKNVAPLLSLSRAERARGDGDAALAAANRAAKIAPENGDVALEIVFAQLVRRDENATRDALSVLGNFAAPQYKAQASALRGFVALRDGKTSESEIEFRAALALSPELYQARSLLALSLLTQNKIAEAEIEARAATKTQKFSAQSQGALSMVLFFRGELSEAQKSSESAISVNPDSPFALLAQGRVLIAQGQLAGAHDSLARAQSLAPELPIVAVELGEVYLRLKQFPKAEQNFRLALTQNPNFAAAHAGLGAALEARGETDAALLQYRQALQLDASDTSARTRLASFFIAQGDLPKAEAEIPKDLAPTPANALLLARLSEVSLLRQDLMTAQNYARRAVNLLPNSSQAHYQLGRVYLEQGRTFQAEQQFRQATILDRENTAARFALGTVREAIADGRDFSRASSLLSEANLGGAGRGINLQNVQSPGAEERIQAALQDPTVARNATRSYGDTQIDGEIGTKDFRAGSVSSLLESRDRLRLFGATASHEKRNGALENSDQTQNRLSVQFGQKTADDSAGLFVLAQNERNKQGMNTDIFNPFARDARSGIDRSMFIIGGNLQKNASYRTRFLLQTRKVSEETRGYMDSSTLDSDGRNYNVELRHDRQLDARNYLSAGFSFGRTQRAVNVQSPFFGIDSRYKFYSQQLYVRNEFEATRRLTLTGEIQVKRIQNAGQSVFSSIPPPPPPFQVSTDSPFRTSFLPKVIVDYRLNNDTNLRLRARRFALNRVDAELLRPTDLFSNDFTYLPQLSSDGRGDSLEFEAEHTFANASFVRVNMFFQKLNAALEPAADIGAGSPISSTRIKGLNVDYESSLGRNTTFYVSGRWTDAHDEDRNRQVAFIPRFLGETGIQFLQEDGFFVQPSYVYQSSRVFTPTSAAIRERSPGFGIMNLRVGKRNGLNSVFYAEVVNAFDQNFDILGIQQAGRQFRVGASRRF